MVTGAHGKATQELSFTQHDAKNLGEKLLRWGSAEWQQGNVSTKRVQKSKKNKGHKRTQWIAEVKAFHAGRGKGHSKGKPVVKEEPKTFPSAPWWSKPPTQETTTIHDDDTEEEEVPPVEPVFLDKPGQNGNGRDGGGSDESMPPIKIFGP